MTLATPQQMKRACLTGIRPKERARAFQPPGESLVLSDGDEDGGVMEPPARDARILADNANCSKKSSCNNVDHHRLASRLAVRNLEFSSDQRSKLDLTAFNGDNGDKIISITKQA
jgi:hypothetical protein